MRITFTAVALVAAMFLAVCANAAGPKSGVDYELNLSRVPEGDPAATEAPGVVDSMKGLHPRLLFTEKEIAALKPVIEQDPLLKTTADADIQWSKRAKTLDGTPPDIVMSDTPALVTSMDRLTRMAYSYGLTGDPTIKTNIVAILQALLDEPHWAHAEELDSNMGAGNNMFMAGMLFDAVCSDLDPEFRVKMAEKLLTHVRRMYYLGHEQKSQCKIKYWQQDPANNHRWHRAAGVTASLLAVADIPELKGRTGYMLQQFKAEMDFLTKWYPADGDCHEGAGYQKFGFLYLALAATMWDRVMGTEYLKHPGFANAWAQQLYYWAPGRQSYMTFGDAPNSEGVINHLGMGFFISPRLSRDKNVQAAVMNFYQKNSVDRRNGRQNTSWVLMAVYDPTVGEGDYKAIPTYRLFADLGAASMRDSWEDDAVLFTFKCGPYGGYKLNEYRHANPKDGKPHYVNIAHDDPDANSFALGSAGEFYFHPGNYAQTKKTELHNTITVDGKGQLQEGDTYTQPTPEVDMRTLSYLTGWKVGEGDRIIVEGEAGPAYETLDRFRRTCIWMPGEYVLILDDIRAAGDADHRITWRACTEKGQFEQPEDGWSCVETEQGKRLDFQMLANKEFNGSIDNLMLTGRWSGLLLNQFQFFQDTDAIKFACLMDPWKKKPTMTLSEKDDVVTIVVNGEGIDDVWTWASAADMDTPSLLEGTRGNAALLCLTADDKAPRGE